MWKFISIVLVPIITIVVGSFYVPRVKDKFIRQEAFFRQQIAFVETYDKNFQEFRKNMWSLKKWCDTQKAAGDNKDLMSQYSQMKEQYFHQLVDSAYLLSALFENSVLLESEDFSTWFNSDSKTCSATTLDPDGLKTWQIKIMNMFYKQLFT